MSYKERSSSGYMDQPCPKCGAPNCTDSKNGWVNYWSHECLYVNCDSDDCKALVNPETEDQLREALEHWKTHSYLRGCSHGS